MFSLPTTLMAPSAAGTIDGAPRGAQAGPLISSTPAPIRPNALIIFSAPAGGAVSTRTMGATVCRNRNYNTNSNSTNSTPSRGTNSPLLPTPIGPGGAGGDQFFSLSNLPQAAAAPARHQNQNQHYHHHQRQQQQQQQQQAKPLSPSGLNDSLPTQILPHLFVGNQEQTNRETVNKLNIKYILSLGLLPIVSSNSNCCHSSTPSPNSPNKSTATNNSTTSTSTTAATSTTTNSNYNVTTSTSMAASQSRQQQQQQQTQQILMPTPNSSVDFKIRIRSNTPTPCTSTITGNPVALSTRSSSSSAAATAATAAGATKTDASATMPQSATIATSTPTSQAEIAASLLRGDDENKGVKQIRSIHCKCINISDNSDQMLIKFFDEACAFIDEARRKKCNILIHCLAGISRSPTIAIAYLMRVKSLHWKDAYDMVKRCRPQIDPNLNFMAQLRIYNKSLRDETKKLKLATNKRLQL